MTVEEITQIPTRLTNPSKGLEAEDVGFSKDPKITAAAGKLEGSKAVPEADYSFWDFLDLINPLQHIPVVNTIYREVTGDTIKPEMKIAGGTMLGGVFGAISSLADVVFEQETGKDIGSTLVASVFGDTKDAPVTVAKADTAAIEQVEAATEQMRQPALSPAVLPRPARSDKNEDDQRRERLSQIDPMDQHVLDLYGKSSPIAASRAYSQADMRGYLQQASLSQTF